MTGMSLETGEMEGGFTTNVSSGVAKTNMYEEMQAINTVPIHTASIIKLFDLLGSEC